METADNSKAIPHVFTFVPSFYMHCEIDSSFLNYTVAFVMNVKSFLYYLRFQISKYKLEEIKSFNV